MKRLVMPILIIAVFVLVAGLGRKTEAREKFVFPDDVAVVKTPTLPPGYTQWKNNVSECKLKDGRVLKGKLFFNQYTKEGLDYVERFIISSLDNRDFIYLHYTVVGRWQEISGLAYFLVDGKWGEFKIEGPMEFMRATEYLVVETRKELGINDEDLDGCE